MKENNNRFFLYVRKSSESDEKQAQSIEDQIRVMTEKARNMGYNIIGIFKESKSAKEPYIRTEFYKMIEEIKKNKASGIIAWKLDRLSRNPVDTGTIQYMLQKNKINIIYTNDREYLPVDSGLLFSVETGMANQYILDLSKNVRRGMENKYEKGIRPTRAPLGYLNDKENRNVKVDDKNFPLIRELWNLMLTGNYNPSKILSIANDKLGIRQKSGRKLGRSGIYFIFNNIFYAGYFYYKGELKKGIHSAMVTLEEFNEVQKILGKKGNTRAQTKEFSYTGIMRCGECGAMVTAETKQKQNMSTGKIKEYIYYHCTGRKIRYKCKQKSIRLEGLEQQIDNIIKVIDIDPKVNEWLLEILKGNINDNHEQKLRKFKNLSDTILEEERRLKRLTDLLLEELISEKDYKIRKKELQESIEILKEEKDNIDLKSQRNLEIVEDAFNFITLVGESFKLGNLQQKKNIISTFGKNLILKDGVLNLDISPGFKTIKKEIPELKADNERLELTKKVISINKTNDLGYDFSKWFGI